MVELEGHLNCTWKEDTACIAYLYIFLSLMLLLSLGLGLNVLVLCINVFNLTGFRRDHFGNKAILSLLGMSAF